MGEVRALAARGSNWGGRGGHLTTGKGFEWGDSEAKLGAGSRSKGRLGAKREAAGAGGGGHWRLTQGRRSSTPQETACPRSGGTETTPNVSQPGRAVRDGGLSRPGGGRQAEGAGGPAASAAPSPRVSPKTPPLLAPDVATAATARQSHPQSSTAGPSLPLQVGAVDNGGAPQPPDPGTSSGSSAAQGRTPTPAAAMMDYESFHNEARPRPQPRPRRRLPRALREPRPSQRRFSRHRRTFLLWSPCRQRPTRHDL